MKQIPINKSINKQQLSYGHYTGQSVLANTPVRNWELRNFAGAKFYCPVSTWPRWQISPQWCNLHHVSPLFMVALCNRADHYIFALWFLSSFFFLFFLAKSQRLEIGCLPYFHTWCGLSANSKCTSEMCCMRLTENTGCKKSPFWHHRTTLSGYIFAAEACIDNRKRTC